MHQTASIMKNFAIFPKKLFKSIDEIKNVNKIKGGDLNKLRFYGRKLVV